MTISRTKAAKMALGNFDPFLDKIQVKPRKNKNDVAKFIQPSAPNIYVYCDLLYLPEEKIPRTKKSYKYLINVVDGFTKGIDFEPLINRDAASTMKALKLILQRGHLFKPVQKTEDKNQIYPVYLVCDAGSEFNNDVFRSELEKLGTKLIITKPQRKSQNAIIESYNKIVSDILNKKMTQEQYHSKKAKSWTKYLSVLRDALNDHYVKEDVVRLEYPKIKVKDLLKIGQKVLVKSEVGRDVNNNKLKGNSRLGDVKYDMKYKVVKQILNYQNGNTVRYVLTPYDGASYLATELMKITDSDIAKYNLQQ